MDDGSFRKRESEQRSGTRRRTTSHGNVRSRPHAMEENTTSRNLNAPPVPPRRRVAACNIRDQLNTEPQPRNAQRNTRYRNAHSSTDLLQDEILENENRNRQRHRQAPRRVEACNSGDQLNTEPQPRNAQRNTRYRNAHSSTHLLQDEEDEILENENRNRQRQRHRQDRNIHFKKLEELSELEPQSLIMELIGQQIAFENLLDSNLSNDTLVLVVKVLVKACSISYRANKTMIMNLASSPKFHSSLQDFALKLLLADYTERKRSSYFWNDIKGFFNNVAVVIQTIIETTPTRACEVLPKTLKAFILTLTTSAIQSEVPEALKDKFLKLQEKLTVCQSNIETKKKINSISYDNDYEEPPDDFRLLQVYPSSDEIMVNDRPFVRKNLIDKKYNSVDHYLDVQFRLLREDFVAPLREGISGYMQQDVSLKRNVKISNIRVHKDVVFLSPKVSRDQVGVLLQFEFRHLKKKTQNKCSYTKRFMYGSLVCFTKDNFATFLFGKVVDRSAELLENGQIVVGFDPGYDNYVLNEPYLMIECSVYFEPYYHVLKALQVMQEDGFPMKKYIIDVDPSIESPRYLRNEAMYNISGFHVPLFGNNWPTAEQLQLDDSQYDAFRCGITEEFVVIQGPPGTGKTFLGLKIARTLIENKSCWYNETPILVVCYTNHALDQFLEGLIETTTDIVRVGGQSKNENLAKFNLKEKRKAISRNTGNHALYATQKQLQQNLLNLNTGSELLDDISKCSGIINFNAFSNIDDQYSTSWFTTASEEDIFLWLLGGRTSSQRRFERNKARLEQLKTSKAADLDEETSANMELDGLLYEQDRAQYEFEDDIGVSSRKNNQTAFLTSLDEISSWIKVIEKELHSLTESENRDSIFNKRLELEDKLFELQDNLHYMQVRLEESKGIKVRNKPNNCNLQNPQHMLSDDRWQLYFYWLELYRQFLINDLVRMQTSYRGKLEQYKEVRNMQDAHVMKKMLVVGMTTTGAARLQTVLQDLQSAIVIVEEAAEVLESHIVVSLTNHCQHLILIGDHQQLRPSTANYRMEKHFNLGISLFERMVQNRIRCHVLKVQHRMRPEIAKLIVPAIYPELENHPSVYNFPSVAGVVPVMYFIDHNYLELETQDNSKVNIHEAEFLIAFAQYLIQNGYQPEDVTILAAYSGQMFALWKERKKYLHLKDVRITVLDNYQGEESKIILLSLVRSNKERKIGFLKIDNRVCVALSRAREGFFLMGNMSLLCQASEIWPKISSSLQEQKCLGTSLTLRCQIHPEQLTIVKVAKDFQKVPEGGCSNMCDAQMKCGHFCTMVCHIKDRAHETTRCTADCTKMLCENSHSCPKLCFQDCGLCVVPMMKTLPCLHNHILPCCTDVEQYKCPSLIKVELPCGHVDPKKPCHVPLDSHSCPFLCETRVKPCGHSCTQKCHFKNDPDHLTYKCTKKCQRPAIGCSTGDHICRRDCYEECSQCEVPIKKRRTACAHPIEIACNQNPDTIKCISSCRRLLSCGHACKKKCFETCGDCNVQVLKKLNECGHEIRVKCSEIPNRKFCDKQCSLTLNCGHVCPKLCIQDCGPCDVPMMKTLPCLHNHILLCCTDVEQYKCPSLIKVELPCGHVDPKKPCHAPLDSHTCPFPCETRVEPCGHSCTQKCHFKNDPDHLTYKCTKKCQRPAIGCSTDEHTCRRDCFEECSQCEVPIKKRRTACTHRIEIACNQNPDTIKCIRSCRRLLPCGHACKKKCFETCGDCKERVMKKLNECGHELRVECSEMPNRKFCDKQCPLTLNCSHVCQERCNEPCTKQCKVLVDHKHDSDCGHKFKIECYLSNSALPSRSYELLQFCDTPCKAVLECGHFCSGTCGKCAQGRIHTTCTERCGVPLICGHECPIPCREACQPCDRKCPYKCSHASCGKKCGEPCTKCTERCSRACEHTKCGARCGDMCTVPSCSEPCLKKLPCEHPCVGFCGDPCPRLCRICHHEELTEIFFGNEDEEDARFVVLDECHHVLESEGMESWLKLATEKNEIIYTCCPKCKSPLTSTQRYSDYIKLAMADVVAVKQKYFGADTENERKRQELNNKITKLRTNESVLKDSKWFKIILEIIAKSVDPVFQNRRQPLSIMLAQIYLSKLQIIENIVDTYASGKLKYSATIKNAIEHMDFLFSFLLREERKMTNQEISDFQNELKRFSRFIQVCGLSESPAFSSVITTNLQMKIQWNITIKKLNSIHVYSVTLDEELRKNITELGKVIGSVLTEYEMKQIVKAMQMQKGHWFKCPNGHVYAIGECGGAMQIGKCVDCGARIGGQSHTLLPDNRHAAEMDGSQYAAYSETANNLFNYEGFMN